MKKKIVLLGDSAVGKTSLIRRFVFDQFEDTYISTIGSKVTKKDLKLVDESNKTNLTLMIWDLIGREGYHALHSRTFVGTHGAILVADLTRRETLLTLERYWIPFLFKIVESVPLVFVSNKSDLKADFEFQPDEISEIASLYNGKLERYLPMGFKCSYSTSAKTGSMVESAFETLGHMMLHSKDLVDPVTELYQSLIATDIRKSLDTTTPVGALDKIIIDFCEGFDDSRLSMMILRQEVARASLNINDPNKRGITKVVEYLAEAENEFKDKKTVKTNLKRRLNWVKNIKK
jgi:small GTP-binding protein